MSASCYVKRFLMLLLPTVLRGEYNISLCVSVCLLCDIFSLQLLKLADELFATHAVLRHTQPIGREHLNLGLYCSDPFHYWSFQGTFLVGQPGGSGKQGTASSTGHAASSPTSVTQQAIRVTAGQKAAILAQVWVVNKSFFIKKKRWIGFSSISNSI